MAGTSAADVQDFHLRSDLQERYKGTNIQDCSGKAFKGSVRWNVCGGALPDTQAWERCSSTEV